MKTRSICLAAVVAAALAVPATASAMVPTNPSPDLAAGPTTADSGSPMVPTGETGETGEQLPPAGEETATDAQESVGSPTTADDPAGGVVPPAPTGDDQAVAEKIEAHEGKGVGAATEEDCNQMADDANGAAREAVEGIVAGQFDYALEMFAFGMERIQTAKDRKCVVTNSEEGESKA